MAADSHLPSAGGSGSSNPPPSTLPADSHLPSGGGAGYADPPATTFPADSHLPSAGGSGDSGAPPAPPTADSHLPSAGGSGEGTAAIAVVSSITPDNGIVTGGTAVTITGTLFTGATAVVFGTVSQPVFTVVDPTTITCVTPPGITYGPVFVNVTSPSGTSTDNPAAVFTYWRTPIVTSLVPATGPDTGGTPLVRVNGQGFTGATAVLFDGVPGTGLIFTSDIRVDAYPPAHAPAVVHVQVVTPHGTSTATSADEFTYTSDIPTITSLSPNEGPIAGGTTVTITGTNLDTATALTIDGINVFGSIIVDSPTQVRFTTPAHAIGSVTVVLTNSGGSANASFLYYAPLTITSLTPDHGPSSGGTTVVVAGSGFTGATAVSFGITNGTSLHVTSDAQLEITSPVHAAGATGVTVTNSRATSSPSTFTYEAPAPDITLLTPNEGLAAGGTTVDILGSNIDSTTSVTVDGSSVSFIQIDSTHVRFTTPAHAVGVVSIVLTTAGGSDSLPFTYYRLCTVTNVAPVSGSTLGGTSVTVTGTGFLGTTDVKFGVTSGTGLHVTSDTQLEITTPAHVAGVVDVRVTNTRETSPITAADQFEFRTAPTITNMSPVEGPIAGGTLVTLTGTFLDTVTSLTVGGVSNAYTIVDPTTITFVTPAHAVGPVTIAVFNTYGSGASPPTTFLYYAPITVTSIVPPVGSSAGGQTVTVHGTGLTGAIAVAFGATTSTTITVIDDTTLTVLTPAHADGTVDVRVTNTRATSPVNAPADEFTFVPVPTLDSIDPTSGTVIGGTLITITGTHLTGATAVAFGALAGYAVTVIDDTTLTVKTPISTTPGPVLVAVTTPGGVTSEAVYYTYTNLAPIAVASATAISGEVILTIGFSSDGSVDPDGGYIIGWLWDFGDGSPTSSLNGPIHSYLNPGIYTATLTVTDNAGATGTDTIDITVTERPDNTPPVAVASALPLAADAPVRVQFDGEDSYDLDGAVVIYYWEFGDGGVSYGINPSHVYLTPGLFSATLTVTDNNGATNTSAPILVNVGTPPIVYPPAITSISPDHGSTAGGTAIRIKGLHLLGVLDVTFVTPGVGGTSTPGTILRIIDDNSMSVLSPPGTGIVNIRVRNSADTSTVGSQTLYTYKDPPTAIASADPIEGKAPLTVQFSSAGSSSPLGALTSYYWTFGDGSLLDFGDNDSSTEQNPTHTYLGPGIFHATLTVTDRLGVVASATVTITVDPEPGNPDPYPGGGGGPGPTGPGGEGGGWTGGGDPPTDPPYIDATCDIDSAHVHRSFLSWAPGRERDERDLLPLFDAVWTARRLRSGVLFTVKVTILNSFLMASVFPLEPFPSKVFFGAISITGDGHFPGPGPTGSTANTGLIHNPSILAVGGGLTLETDASSGVFTPIVNGGGTGVDVAQTFTLQGLAPAALDIAYAQVGFISQYGRSVGDVDFAWISVDCVAEALKIEGGWTISDPGMGGGGFAVGGSRVDPNRQQRRS